MDHSTKSPSTFSRVPHWLVERGVSGGALKVFVALGKYADNGTGRAWPSHETLAKDLGVGISTVKRGLKELEKLGAVKVVVRPVEHDRNMPNLYVLIFEEPAVSIGARDDATDTPLAEKGSAAVTPVPETTGGWGPNLNPTWGPEMNPELDPSITRSNSYTPDGPFHAHASVPHAEKGSGSDSVMDDLTSSARKRLRDLLRAVGRRINEGHGFWDEPVQDAWTEFTDGLETETGHLAYADDLMGLVLDQWSVTGKVVEPLEAGTELNKMLATARGLSPRRTA